MARITPTTHRDIDLVERTSDFSTTLASEDVPAMTITIPPTDKPVWVEAKAIVQNSAGTKWVEITATETSATASGDAIDLATVDAANGRVSLEARRRLAASSSQRTYKMQVFQQTAGNTTTLTFTGLGAPAFLRAYVA